MILNTKQPKISKQQRIQDSMERAKAKKDQSFSSSDNEEAEMNDVVSSDGEGTDESDDQKALSSRGAGGLAGTLSPQAVVNLEKDKNKKRSQDSTEDIPAKRVAAKRTNTKK
jgi:hypothetical protein